MMCPKCLAPMDDKLDAIGRVTWKCPNCDRRPRAVFVHPDFQPSPKRVVQPPLPPVTKSTGLIPLGPNQLYCQWCAIPVDQPTGEIQRFCPAHQGMRKKWRAVLLPKQRTCRNLKCRKVFIPNEEQRWYCPPCQAEGQTQLKHPPGRTTVASRSPRVRNKVHPVRHCACGNVIPIHRGRPSLQCPDCRALRRKKAC